MNIIRANFIGEHKTTSAEPEDMAKWPGRSYEELAGRYDYFTIWLGFPDGHPGLPAIINEGAVPCWVMPTLNTGVEPQRTDSTGFALLVPWSYLAEDFSDKELRQWATK